MQAFSFICPRCNRVFKHEENLILHLKTCSQIPDWIIELDDDHLLKQRYANKCTNAKKENIECELSFEEYCQKIKDANLHSSDIGFSNGSKKYVLARENDSGNYKVDNCRFITQTENAREKQISDASIKAAKNIVDRINSGEYIRNNVKPSKNLFLNILVKNKFKICYTANNFGVSKATIDRWIKDYEIDTNPFPIIAEAVFFYDKDGHIIPEPK